MLSKNNFTERLKKMEPQTKKERFSIRKLTIGAASVLISLGFLGANSQVARAADGEQELNNNIQSSKANEANSGSEGAANESAGSNVHASDKQKQTGTTVNGSTKMKLSTFAGLSSFLRDGTETIQSVPTSDGSESAASALSQEEKENESKKAEAEQKLDAAAASLSTTLGKANETSGSDTYQHETPEKQQALQDAVNKAQVAINKYRDPNIADLPEADQTKLLADINAAQDDLTALLAGYTAAKEEVGAQDGISLRYNSGFDGDVAWSFDNGTMTFTGRGTLSSKQIQNLGVSASSITKIAFTGPANAIKLAANSAFKFAYLNKLTDIQGIGNLDATALVNISNMFNFDANLTNLDLSGWHTSSSLKYMSNMFATAYLTENSKLNSVKFGDNWDTSNVRDMSNMFYQDLVLSSIDFGRNWNTSSVTNMYDMFIGCWSLRSLDIGNWNTSKVTNMYSMFQGCKALSSLDIGSWNTSKVTNMYSMFQDCKTLSNLDIDNWDTSHVNSMVNMFNGCSGLTSLSIGSWDTSKVTNMQSLFKDCSKLSSLSIGKWNTDLVTNMSCMFQNTTEINNLDLHTYTDAHGNHWNTSRVTDMSSMFANKKNAVNSSLNNLDLSGWDTSKVTNMQSMFQYDAALTTNSIENKGIANFKTDLVSDMSHMFEGDSSIESLTLGDGTHFKTDNVGNMSFMFSDMTGMKKISIDNFNTSAVSDMSHMFNNDLLLDNLGLNISDNKFDTKFVEDMSYMFNNCQSLTSTGTGPHKAAFDVSNFNTRYAENMAYMFNGCRNLTSLVVTNWDTSQVTDMQHMFDGDAALTGLNVGGWKTGQVTNMQYMFSGDTNLTSPAVTDWDTSQVTDMQHMFDSASSITSLDLHKWNTESVGNAVSSSNYHPGMQYMFNNASSLTILTLGPNWNTENVKDMSYMFNNDNLVTDLNSVSNFNTSQVTDMQYMFNDTSSLLSLDLSRWDTSSVQNMQSMFNNDSALITLTLGQNWETPNVTNMSNMFNNTGKLSKLALSAFNTNKASSGNMDNMFNGIGADASIDKFILKLGHHKLDNNVWGANFKWHNIRAIGTDGTIENPKGTAYDLDGFKAVYNKEVSMCPGAETYIMYAHKADNERFTVGPTHLAVDSIAPDAITLKVHKGQAAKITAEYPMADILSFVDTEIFPPADGTKSYDSLKDEQDDIRPNKKILELAEWLTDKKINQEGNLADGGVVNSDGSLVTDPTNPGTNKGNAVIKLTFGDGTITNVPVKIRLPMFAAGKAQIAAKRTVPSEEKAAAAVKTSASETGLTSWGKSTLSYSWVKLNGSPLVNDDLIAYGDHHVAVKVTYDNDGVTELIPVTLQVKKYSDAYPIRLQDGITSITTHAVGDGSTFSVAPPVGFFNMNKNGVTDNSAMDDLITAKDSATNVDITTENLNGIIDHLEWATGDVAPGFIGLNDNCQIVAKYMDDTTGASIKLKVNVIGGKSNSAASTATGVSTGPAATVLTEANAEAALSNASTVTSAYPAATFAWSKSASSVIPFEDADTETAGTQNVYIIINYGDGTTQAVPVKLKLNNTASLDNLSYDQAYPLHIHATDDNTNKPLLDMSFIRAHLNGITDPTAVSTITWSTENNSVPDHTTSNINAVGEPADGYLQVNYTDGSHSDRIKVPVMVEGAQVLATNQAYLQGTVPAAAAFMSNSTLGEKAPSSYNASYKWVDAATRQELTDLNNTKGIVNAAIEVAYSDNTHQYLPVKLNLQTYAEYYKNEVRTNDFNTHIGVIVDDSSLSRHISVNGLANTAYSLAWTSKPDTSAAGLNSSGSKNINALAKITFTSDGTQLTVRIPGTVVGAVIKNSDVAKTVYLNGSSLSPDQQADIVNYYVNASLITSYVPSYIVQLSNNRATITVHYNDHTNVEQVLNAVPFTVIGPQTKQAEIYQGYSITVQQVLTNYSDLKSNPEITLDDNITGINSSQVGTQSGRIGICYTHSDPEFSHFDGRYSIPVTVKVIERPVDNSMAANLKPNTKPIQVPQYTDLPANNNYAGNAITNAADLPAGTNYTWDTANEVDTTKKDKTSKTFIRVHYPDGSVASVPVTVKVGDPAESEVVLKHNAYLYDKQGKRINKQTLQKGSTIKTYGTTRINNSLYYIVQADKYYIKANNVQGTKRKLQLTAHVYDKYGKRADDREIYAGTSVITYGTPITIDNEKYYLTDNNKYIKASNFPPTADRWNDPTVREQTDTSGGVKKAVMHTAYFYDKNGKRENKAILKAGSEIVTYGKTTIKHKQYYVLDNDEYLLASNIDASKRHVTGKTRIVNRYGKATKKQLRKGTKVSVYGKTVKIKGVKYYIIGDNQYVKASKLK
ncbi:BspA family leucine-rich repeat surface protein [Lactobacillus sp. ESL0791]|uniref:BspA family leucine-rich repeat surface protein n=1 Tax=Lactobacillus sp. ESL0791 TaxID=2983234 RepID=UPI0023F836FD|nr:BspA family leucine-rich repeat surface protein [Lactobacillus sp. ESL0791]MDF7639783.1 BspA family leucine-rich repeat surface protein [Lactobacillus sp. ESL0791]